MFGDDELGGSDEDTEYDLVSPPADSVHLAT